MAKSSRRNKTEGTLDRLSGRVMETFGKLTGRKTTKAKGKAARTRGSARTITGRAKGQAKTGRAKTGRAKTGRAKTARR